MRRPLALLVTAALLLAQTGCSHYSANHRRGLMTAGGAAVFIGAIIAADGAYCDDAGGAAGECGDVSDQNSLVQGTALLAAGVALFLGAYFVKPTPPAAPAPAPPLQTATP
jgi:hypothetical protein